MKKILLVLIILLLTANSLFSAQLPGYSRRSVAEITGTATANTLTPEIELYYRHAKIVDNGIFEWFMKTAVRYTGIYDRVYTTYLTSTGDMNVVWFDENTKTLSDSTTVFSDWSYYSGGGPGDDHGCGAPHIIQNGAHAGKILVAASEHGDPGTKGGRLHIRRTTSAEDISAFDTAVVIETEYTSYVQIVEVANGDIYLFTRYRYNNDYNQSNYVYYKSTDSGTTWSEKTLFANLGDGPTYLMVANDGNDIHFILNWSGTSSTPAGRYHDIYYIKSTDGMSTFEKADGTAVNLPVTPTNGDLVHATEGTHWEFLWDITLDSSGNPYLMSLDSPTSGDATDDVSVFVHSYDSGWSTETVLSTGSKNIGTFLGYFCGAVFADGDPDTVFASVADGTGKGMMQKWEKSGTWSKTEDITTDSPGDSFRPIAVKNAKIDGLFQMLWCYSERYEHWYPGDWDSSLFAYPGYNNGIYGQLETDVRTDFGDVRFTQSDGTTLIGVDGKGHLIEKDDGWYSKWEVKTPVIDDIYIYSGNATSTYPTDDKNEYEAVFGYDRFDGSTLDLTKWTVEPGRNAPTISSNEAVYNGTTDWANTNTYLAIGDNISFKLKTTLVLGGYIAFLKSDGTNRLQITKSLSDGGLTFKSTVDGTDQPEVNFGVLEDTNEYHEYRLYRESQTNTKLYINGELFGTYIENTPSAAMEVGFLCFSVGRTNTYKDVRFNEPFRPTDYTFDILAFEEFIPTNNAILMLLMQQ